MAKTIRIFIGTSINSYSKGTYALTLCNEQNTLYMPSKTIELNSKISAHRLILEAILEAIQGLINVKHNESINVVIYSNNDLIAYEYNSEYIKEGRFTPATKDIEIWRKIVKNMNLTKQNTDYKIVGTNTVLESVAKIKRYMKRK